MYIEIDKVLECQDGRIWIEGGFGLGGVDSQGLGDWWSELDGGE